MSVVTLVENFTQKATEKVQKRIIKAVVRRAHKSEFFTNRLESILTRRFRYGYKDHEDNEAFKYKIAYGKSLLPFFKRVVKEAPKAASSLIDFAFEITKLIEDKKNDLSTLVIEPTNRCNLNCPGCYAASIEKGHNLSYECIKQIIDELMDKSNMRLITLSGGEPMIKEREERTITRLAEYISGTGIIQFYTNGLLIDKETAKRFGKLGNIYPAISIEGFIESTDKRRGKGISEKLREIRQNLKKERVMYGFSATATKENVHEISSNKFFDERLKEGDFFGWIFIYQPIGRQATTDLMVTSKQRYNLGKKVMQKQLVDKIPIFLGDFWNYGAFVDGCIAGGRKYFHIMANGVISPCVFSPFGVGNLNEISSFKDFYPKAEEKKYTDLNDFLKRNPTLVAYREKQNEIEDRFRPCPLIDYPEAVRELATNISEENCYCFPTNNTPRDYFDGEIARNLNKISEDWGNYWSKRLREDAKRFVRTALKEAD